MPVARFGQQLADAGKAIGFAPEDGLGQRRPDEAQQRPQPFQTAPRIVDGGGSVLPACKPGFGNVDLLERDAACTGGDGFIQLESVGHALNNTSSTGQVLHSQPVFFVTFQV